MKTPIKNNSAFPVHYRATSGLTKLEYFTAVVLQGMISRSHYGIDSRDLPMIIKLAEKTLELLEEKANEKE